jgi:hypothetical protein
MPSDDAISFDGEKVDGVLIVIGIDLSLVRPLKRFPLAFVHEYFVAKTKMMFDRGLVEMSVSRRYHVNHGFPLCRGLGTGALRRAGRWWYWGF